MAFYAVVSIGVIGLYLCFAIPIWLRWRAGDSFESRRWTLGPKYKWLCLIALFDIALTADRGPDANLHRRGALV